MWGSSGDFIAACNLSTTTQLHSILRIDEVSTSGHKDAPMSIYFAITKSKSRTATRGFPFSLFRIQILELGPVKDCIDTQKITMGFGPLGSV
jgi:hypothetical protein